MSNDIQTRSSTRRANEGATTVANPGRTRVSHRPEIPARPQQHENADRPGSEAESGQATGLS